MIDYLTLSKTLIHTFNSIDFIKEHYEGEVEGSLRKRRRTKKSFDNNKTKLFKNKKSKQDFLFQIHDVKCFYCEEPAHYNSVNIDHVRPIYRGGTNRFCNLVVACNSCNNSKADDNVLKFIKKKFRPLHIAKLLQKISNLSFIDYGTELYNFKLVKFPEITDVDFYAVRYEKWIDPFDNLVVVGV